MRGIDISNYSGKPTVETANEIRALGYDFAIIGTQQESTARAQLQSFTAAGFRCELYLYPYYDAGDAARIDRAVRLAKEFRLYRIWDDIEWHDGDGPKPDVDRVIAGLGNRLAVYRAAGLDAGIYTSALYWPVMTGGRLDGIIKPSDTPLWHANYREPPLPWAGGSAGGRYGPWSTSGPLIWQYAGSVPVNGVNSDLNELRPGATLDEGLVITHPQPVPPVPPALPTVERALLALQAATATIWTHQDFEHVPQWDRDVLKRLFG